MFLSCDQIQDLLGVGSGIQVNHINCEADQVEDDFAKLDLDMIESTNFLMYALLFGQCNVNYNCASLASTELLLAM